MNHVVVGEHSPEVLRRRVVPPEPFVDNMGCLFKMVLVNYPHDRDTKR